MSEIEPAADWELVRAKFLFKKLQLPPPQDAGTVTAFRDGEVTLRENRRTEGFTFATKEIGYQGVRPGDLVIHAMDAFAGAIGVSDSFGKCSPVYSVCEPKREMDIRYYAYLLRDFALSGRIASLTQGIRERSTDFRYNVFGELRLPYFEVEQQRAIASFLDRETARIDTLLEKKRRLLDLLEEKRTALITRAVTRGLDPDVPMKDSGVEWIGEIPAHWDVRQTRHLALPAAPIIYGIVLPGPDVPEGVSLIKGGDVERGDLHPDGLNRTAFEVEQRHKRSRVHPGDVIYSIRGSFGEAAIVPHTLQFANLTQDAARISPRDSVNPEWLVATLTSAPVRAIAAAGALGATIKGVNIRDLRRLPIPTPPPEEQKRIAEFLGEHQGKLDAVEGGIREAIDLLREYRTALISAAVTGRIEVTEPAFAPA